MLVGIEKALELIANGDYKVIETEGALYNKQCRKIGSLDKPSGNIFYVINRIDILAQRLLYAYYNGGAEALIEGQIITHLDGNKQNNRKNNLTQLPRKGMKQALNNLRKGMCCPVIANAPQASKTVITATTHPTQYTAQEQQARDILETLIEGRTVKEVAEMFNVKEYNVRDIRRGKSRGKATADLRKKLESKGA